MTVQIHRRPESRWVTVGNTSVRGAVFLDDRLLQGESFGELIERIKDEQEFLETLQSLNGFFSVLSRKGPRLLAAVDRVRSMPLFYGHSRDRMVISDDAEYVKNLFEDDRDDSTTTAEFLLAGYVTGKDTLSPHVHQLEAGELLVAELASCECRIEHFRYYVYTGLKENPGNQDALLQELNRVVEGCIQRLIVWAGGRPIILPLSGGYDSRLIAVMLKKGGYTNVSAFTYGRPGNRDAKKSQEVADNLGLPLTFIPYTNSAWWNWFHSQEREAYYRLAHNLCSIPHLQDWPAVWELQVLGKIPRDSVFVPGHTGDFISGGHIPETFLENRDIRKSQFVEEVTKKHFRLWSAKEVDETTFRLLQDRILQFTNVDEVNSPAKAANEFEKWEWQERQAKFIINSVRVYEFWGYAWWMPLWDSDMMNFWRRVPLEWRANRKLYIQYVTDQYSNIGKVTRRVARETDRDDPVKRMKTFFEDRRLINRRSGLFKEMRNWYRGLKRWYRRNVDYENSRFAWFGIMKKATFIASYTGDQMIHSYIAKHILGRLKL